MIDLVAVVLLALIALMVIGREMDK